MMNTDKTLILTFALACAAVPVIAADAPSAAPSAQAIGAAPAAAAASDKPAAPKSKRKKAKSAAKSAAKPGTEPVTESASKPVAKPATTEQSEPTVSGAPAAETVNASPAEEAATPLVEPAATAAPQAGRVRVKDRAAAAAAVAAAQPDQATAEPTAASPASSAPVAEAVPETTKPTDEAPAAAAKPAAQPTAAHDDAGDHAAKAPTIPEPATPAAASAPASASAPVAEPEPMLVAECNPPFKSEVAALFDRWNASLRSGDPKKVVANYAPGALLLPTVSNRARFTVAEKEEYFAYFLKRRPEGRIDDRVIDVDCNSATDSGLYTFRFGDGTQVKARYTFAYKRIDGQWLIASHHSSGMPEKAESATEQKSAKPVQKSVEDTRAWVRFP